MALIATVGAADANSYVTLDEAEAYFETRPNSTAWTSSTDDDKKEASLIMATRLLDARVEWTGLAAGATQALCWPRSGMLNRNGFAISSATLPRELKDAVCELALSLMSDDVSLESEAAAQGLTALTAGPVSLSFKESFETRAVPQHVERMLPSSWIAVPDSGFRFRVL